MKTCAIHLPGNVSCPAPALYVIESPSMGGTKTIRYVCLGHLAAGVDADMRQVNGVTVTMAAWRSR